ncbi:MAG: 4-hydroxy-3-methylbut-2-enyl diphosphate reductase, partial [Alistipes sp.]|nr:4-hydroxy-3-methylbut-2-enyl diphosphate reductase [Alistipes sp.]
MKVAIDSHSGFCAGVVRAISEAESAISKWGSVSCLGDIVHNRIEVQRLEAMGLTTIDHDGIKGLQSGSHMLIRAHGEPPTTYA